MQLPRKASADTNDWQGLNRSERMTSAHWASYSFSSSAGQLGRMSGRVSGWQLQRTIFGLMVWSGCRMMKLSLSDSADVWTHDSSHFVTDTQSASVISHCWYSAIYRKNSMPSLDMESNDSAQYLGGQNKLFLFIMYHNPMYLGALEFGLCWLVCISCLPDTLFKLWSSECCFFH